MDFTDLSCTKTWIILVIFFIPGEKHAKAVKEYVPRPEKKPKTFKTLVDEHDGFVLGLEKIDQFCIEANPDEVSMFKCQVFDCDGAFGDAERFFKHFASTQHADNYFKVKDLTCYYL